MVSFIYYIILYLGFINYLRGGILDPQLSVSFSMLDFSSKNSLWSGIRKSFLSFFLLVCIVNLPKWTKSMSIPQVFEQSLFLFWVIKVLVLVAALGK